jgi:uncharacterized protein YoxC
LTDENFLSNKEIIGNLMDRMNELESSLSETNRIIVKYNGLREDLEETEIEVEEMKDDLEQVKGSVSNIETNQQIGTSIKEKLIKYSSWIFGFIMFMLYLYELGILDKLIG